MFCQLQDDEKWAQSTREGRPFRPTSLSLFGMLQAVCETRLGRAAELRRRRTDSRRKDGVIRPFDEARPSAADLARPREVGRVEKAKPVHLDVERNPPRHCKGPGVNVTASSLCTSRP